MLNKNISLKEFGVVKNKKKIKGWILKSLNYYKNYELVKSFSKNYKYNFSQSQIKKYKKFNNYNLIGMGGSSLGAKAIYNFLSPKIKKKFTFFDNLSSKKKILKKTKALNIIISKSGNTLETISNYSAIKGNKRNLFICENSDNYIKSLANKLNCEIIAHKNYIGGRYSVLSEAGMLPAIFMGLKEGKFKNFNNLIKNKNFINSLLDSVLSTKYFLAKKKFNSVILNYDELSIDLFQWYQQLIAESLGKNSKGILPLISSMPKDNHSLMQLYLDGPKNSFFTFFDVKNYDSPKIKKKKIFSDYKYLEKHDLFSIKSAQKKATINVFKAKGIPFRTFEVLKKNEETLGELFTFFMLETILLGKMLKINPYNQPSVELIKKETKKILI